MVKFFIGVLAMFCWSQIVHSQSSDLGQNPGLKRFDQHEMLGSNSQFDIRAVRVGDNVLKQSLELQQQGGVVHYISKGNRSRNVKISFYQPFGDTRLDQQFRLDFNRNNGFIHTVNVSYKLDSAYADITPIYQQVLEKAVVKYGEPLSFDDIKNYADSTGTRVLLEKFTAEISPKDDVSDAVKGYFSQQIIAAKTAFVADQNGRALLLSGFNQCYLWQKNHFSEVLTLCAFGKNSGNMQGHGVKLELRDFATELMIEGYVKQIEKTPAITL